MVMKLKNEELHNVIPSPDVNTSMVVMSRTFK
jgi:hypothetical protein